MDVSKHHVFNRKRPGLSLPVLMKEMRSRMRGIRAPILLFITTGLTILVGLLIVGMSWNSYADGPYDTYSNLAEIGKALFIGLVILEGILCAVIAPALTAGAISIEREQQTLDLLLLTRLSCSNIVLGKLFSSLGFLLVVLLCSLPVWAISFLLGGIDPGQMFWSLMLIFTTVALFGAIALYCSTRYAKTATSVAVAYCYCVLWLALIPICIALFATIFPDPSYSSTTIGQSWHDIPFVTFAAGSCAVLALIPTTVLSILIGLIFRHSLSRLANIILWAGISGIGLVVMVEYATAISRLIYSGDVPLAFLGNPVAAIVVLLVPDISASGGSHSAFLTHYFIPLTAAIALACTLLVIAQTVQELKRLRNGPPDAKVKRRPRK